MTTKQQYIVMYLAVLGFIVLTLSVSGCATAPGQAAGNGQAAYTYEHTATDGSSCKVTVTSGRDVARGQVQVSNDCALDASGEALTGTEQQKALTGLLNKALDKIRP